MMGLFMHAKVLMNVFDAEIVEFARSTGCFDECILECGL